MNPSVHFMLLRHSQKHQQGDSAPLCFSHSPFIATRVTSDSTVQCVADVRAVLGEGPVWVEREQALYWVDIKGRKIFRLDKSGELRGWSTPFRVGSIVPRKSGGFIAGTDEGIAA